MNIQARVALDKERHPEKYCPVRRCLWRTGGCKCPRHADRLGNTIAKEGCDRCFCGCKYWENDRCIDCGTHVNEVREDLAYVDRERQREAVGGELW